MVSLTLWPATSCCRSFLYCSPTPSIRSALCSLASAFCCIRISITGHRLGLLIPTSLLAVFSSRFSRVWSLVSPSLGCVCLYLLVSPLLTFCNRLLFHSPFIASGPFTCSMLQQIIIVLIFLALRCAAQVAAATRFGGLHQEDFSFRSEQGGPQNPPTDIPSLTKGPHENTRRGVGAYRELPGCIHSTVTDHGGKEVGPCDSWEPKRTECPYCVPCSSESPQASKNADEVQRRPLCASSSSNCELRNGVCGVSRTTSTAGSPFTTPIQCGQSNFGSSSHRARVLSSVRDIDGESSSSFSSSHQTATSSSLVSNATQSFSTKAIQFCLEFFPCFSSDTFVGCAPLALPYALMLALSNRCLYTSQVSGYHVARCSCIPLQLLLELLGAGECVSSVPFSKAFSKGTLSSGRGTEVLNASSSPSVAAKTCYDKAPHRLVEAPQDRLLTFKKEIPLCRYREAAPSSTHSPLLSLPSSWSARYCLSCLQAGKAEDKSDESGRPDTVPCPGDPSDGLPTLHEIKRPERVQSGSWPLDPGLLATEEKSKSRLLWGQGTSERNELLSEEDRSPGDGIAVEDRGFASRLRLFVGLLFVPVKSVVSRSAWTRLLSREGIEGRLQELQVSRRRLLASLCVSIGFLLLTAEGRKLSVEGAAMGLGASFFGALYMQMSSKIVKRMQGVRSANQRQRGPGQTVSAGVAGAQEGSCAQLISEADAQRALPETDARRSDEGSRGEGRENKEMSESEENRMEADEGHLLSPKGEEVAILDTSALESHPECMRRKKKNKETSCQFCRVKERRDHSNQGNNEERQRLIARKGDGGRWGSNLSVEEGNRVGKRVGSGKGNFEVGLALHSAAVAAALLSPLALSEHLWRLHRRTYSSFAGSSLSPFFLSSSSVLPRAAFSPLSPFFVPFSVSFSVSPPSDSPSSFSLLTLLHANERKDLCLSLGLLFLSGLLAAVMPLTSYVCFRHLSPLSCCVVGFLKSSSQILLTPLLAREGAPTPSAALAAGVCLLGCGVYAYDSYCRIVDCEAVKNRQAEKGVSEEGIRRS
ncbi:transmembrane protein [Cystoisospora suis]|uniref:Transmembrane protein n=1 Tax=Cystoisospora suis TaxID=483139 RepID=A0A2C6L477_9APIC|nr:transmembrane protein [Cystoisospora suis]